MLMSPSVKGPADVFILQDFTFNINAFQFQPNDK